VIGASQPISGVFSFAGKDMNNGLNDFVVWKNTQGGVLGRKLRYVSEDSGFKLDQGVAIFKKIMAAEKPSFFYGDSTQWAKAVSQDAIASNSIMTSSTSLASVVADPATMPQHIVPGPTYPRLHEILMEYIARSARGAAEKPKIAYVYADTEFGRDGIPGGKARAEKLGLPIVAEIITKQSGIDVAPEVAKLRRAKPDIVIFQGYIAAPMPEFVRQLREAGMNPQIMGTAWGLDRPAYDAMGALGVRLTGVSMYRYGHDTESSMINNMRTYLATARPEQKNISPFYISAWLTGMIFAEIAERCIKANKPLLLPNMKAALESMKEWDTGGITGLLADVSQHQIPVGRMYSYDPDKKTMEPASGWIKV
jgi:branched-chain amino acid transport system substrate-binding protein